MFADLIQWLTTLWQAVSAFLDAIWVLLQKWLTSTWGAIVIITGLTYSTFSIVFGLLGQAYSAMQTMPSLPSISNGAGIGAPVTLPTGIAAAMGFLNSMLPINEVCGYLVSYLTFCGLLLGIRFIKWLKSWLWSS